MKILTRTLTQAAHMYVNQKVGGKHLPVTNAGSQACTHTDTHTHTRVSSSCMCVRKTCMR